MTTGISSASSKSMLDMMSTNPKNYSVGRTRVTEYNYVLPKGKHSNLVGSFSYSPPSAKSGNLKAQISSMKGKLQRLKYSKDGNTPAKRRWLENKIRQLQSQLCAEVEAQGIVRVNVYEEDDE